MSTEWSEVEPIVSISDVVRDTVKVRAEQLRVGDIVFDIFGGEHAVDAVRLMKREARFRRADRADFESFPREHVITIKRER